MQREQNQKPGRRRSFTPAEETRIALRRHQPQKTGGKVRLPSWSALAGEFDRDPRLLQQASIRAFERGHVKVIEVPRLPAECVRVEGLEKALHFKFKVRRPIVVDTDEFEREYLKTFHNPGHYSALNALDDEIHRILGAHMARIIEERFIFDDSCVIGLGAGRGVYYILEALLLRKVMLDYTDVALMSLSGFVHPHDYASRLSVPLDSDYHVWLMASCFSTQVRLQQVYYPITCEKRDDTPLGQKSWKEFHPQVILAGVGALSSGHRFYDAAKSVRHTAAAQPDTMLAPIMKELSELVEICDRISKLSKAIDPAFWPVGDICHRLYYVQPPASVTVPPTDQAHAERLIKCINDKLLNVSEGQLREVQIALVAGTLRKAYAIHELLRAGRYNVRVLCIDKKAAEKILEIDTTERSHLGNNYQSGQ
ncbi:hypothetical protein [Paludibaculum fermentans]|uniref:hypothetical protein n=1 Tax=Paludibaculum fermentans TaxID=1473598 RepID=UPI003EBFEFFA